MKYAYFDPNQGGRVLLWIDTEAANYNLPDKTLLHACTDEEWQLDRDQEWAVIGEALVLYSPPEVPTTQMLANRLRLRRDTAIAETDWLVQRHRDELDMGRETTIVAAAFSELLVYRKALRDLPLTAGFPNLNMPSMPEAIAEIVAVAQ